MRSFENFFFARYRQYLIEDLNHADAAIRLLAAQRLGQIVYPD